MKFNEGSIFWVESFDVGFGEDRDLGCFDLVLKHLASSHCFNQTVIDTKIQFHLWRENCFHCFLLNGSKLVIRVTMVFFLTNIILMSTDLSFFANQWMKRIGFVLHLFLIRFLTHLAWIYLGLFHKELNRLEGNLPEGVQVLLDSSQVSSEKKI